MKKGQNKGIIAILLIIAIASLFIIFNQSFNIIGDEYTYVEERCIDVQPWKDQGYITTNYDENDCEIVEKRIQDPNQQRTTDGRVCYCQSGCISTFEGGTAECREEFGATWELKKCSGSLGVCINTFPDTKGGLEQIVNTCTFEPEQVFVIETFVGPFSLDTSKTRFSVQGFCNARPAILTSGTESSSSTNIYDDLLIGETVFIEDGDTLILYYVSDVSNTNQVSPCASGEVYNANTLQCSPSTPTIFSCSAGIQIAGINACVVTTQQCNEGTVKNILENGSIECISILPPQYSCFDSTAYYSEFYDRCVRIPSVDFACQANEELFMPTSEQCVQLNGDWVVNEGCPEGQTCFETNPSRCSIGNVCLIPKIQVNTTVINEAGGFEEAMVDECPVNTNEHEFTNQCVQNVAVKAVTCPATYELVNGKCFKAEKEVNMQSCPGEIREPNICVITELVNNTIIQVETETVYETKFKDNPSLIWTIAGLSLVILFLLFLLLRRGRK